MTSLLRKLEWHKNNKFLYYCRALYREAMPGALYRSRLNDLLETVHDYDPAYIRHRLTYYNKLMPGATLGNDAVALQNMTLPKRQRVYYFDTVEYTHYFNPVYKIEYKFGDVTRVPDSPALVKSRPISNDNVNAVVMKLDKARHFTFLTDKKDFTKKKNMLVGRAVVRQPHRIRFYDMYFNNPMCNLGQINPDKNVQWIKDRLTVQEHLDYKFILCLEGNDVATNLKWVMSSQSLPVMPKPKFETWFLEGTLIPNYHYMAIRDDYSDLEERMQYYIDHPEEAQAIIRNANEYVRQFWNKKREDVLSLLVLEKYFHCTGQHESAYAHLFI